MSPPDGEALTDADRAALNAVMARYPSEQVPRLLHEYADEQERQLRDGGPRQRRGQPYVRPTMAEVRAVPYNGLTAVSTFSGAGGSSLGLRMAGWRVPYAVEFVPAAVDTYEANFPDAFVDRRNVGEIAGEEILARLGLARGELDLLESSPPCASWSSAGARERAWGEVRRYSDARQRTDDLFEVVHPTGARLCPRAFVAENVPGMTHGPAAEFRWVIDARGTTGGRVRYRISAGGRTKEAVMDELTERRNAAQPDPPILSRSVSSPAILVERVREVGRAFAVADEDATRAELRATQ